MKKIILWIVGGIIFVTGAFVLPGYSGDIWSAVISGSIAAFLYLTIFTVVWVKKINSPVKQKSIAAVIAILILSSSIFWLINYEDSVRQRQFLKDLRVNIESSVAYSYVHESLLKSFRLYHTAAGNKSMAKIFQSGFDSLITEDSLYQYHPEGDSISPNIYVSEISKDRIVLVGVSKYVSGKNPEFKNYSGKKGKFQVKGILTQEGIQYERTN